MNNQGYYAYQQNYNPNQIPINNDKSILNKICNLSLFVLIVPFLMCILCMFVIFSIGMVNNFNFFSIMIYIPVVFIFILFIWMCNKIIFF